MSAVPPPPPPPPSGSAPHSACKAKYASPAVWVAQVRDRQLSQMTAEDRDRLVRVANEAQERTKQAVSARKCAARSKWVSHSSSHAYNEQASMSRMAPGTARSDERERCSAKATREMEACDDEMSALPDYMVAQAMVTPHLALMVQGAAPMAENQRMALDFVTAAVSDTTATGAPAPPKPEVLDERRKALGDLRAEPHDDAECAAKFKIFESFSSRLDTIRAALMTVAATTCPTFPPAPRQAVERDIKKLDDHANMQIADQSRNWFVHDMTEKLFSNSDKIEAVSAGIERKAGLLRQEAQSSCPICMEAFVDPAATTASGGDDDVEPCVPRVLQCCHQVCEPCWAQWVQLKGPSNAFCPLCKNREFLEEISRM